MRARSTSALRHAAAATMGTAFTAALLTAAPAAAQVGCSVPSATGAVTCTSDGNPYPAGITQVLPGNLSLTTAAGVQASGRVTGTSTGGTVTGVNAGTLFDGAIYTAGAGNVTVTNSGVIGSTTVNRPGLRAVATAGNAVVTSTGVIASSFGTGSAVSVAASGNATLTLGNVTAAGGGDGVSVTANTGISITLNGVTTAIGAQTVRATGSGTTLVNNGVLNSGITLSAFNDTFTNAGTVQFTRDSDFGAGVDALNNTGTFRVLANGGPTTTVTLANLEAFNNSGTVSLLNNRTGDRLVVPGGFVGTGASTVALDIGANFTGAADVLQVNAAAGQTTVVLNTPIGSNFTPSFGAGPVIVQAAAASSPTAFVIGAAQNGGANALVNFAVAYNPTTFAYSVVGVPGISAFRLTRFVEGQRAVFYRATDTWSAHVASVRDALAAGTDGGGRLWGSIDGSEHSRRGALGATAFGVAQSFSTSYRQDAFSGTLGFDVVAPTAQGGFSFGVMGGYTSSTLRIVGSLDRIYYHVATGAAYASYTSGTIFANVTGRYQHSWNSLRSSAGFATNDPDANVYGAAGEVGIRFGSDNFFIEPVAGVDYVHVSLKNFTAIGATFVFDEDDGLRGKAGARLGTTMPIGTATATLYVSGQAVHEFQGRDRIAIATGANGVVIGNDRPGTYGHGKAGFSVAAPGGVTGFVEGFADYGDEYRGGGGRAGIAIKF